MSGFAFANVGMLVALIALPAIWYLLRLMPPKPPVEQFPPTRLLLDIASKEEQPARSPWWLTALRLTLAAAVILALAGPTFKATGEVAPGSGALLIVIDNGWAAAPGWATEMASAHRLVEIARAANRPTALLATAEPASQPLEPTDAEAVLKRLDALKPEPWAGNYAALSAALAAGGAGYGGVAWLSDGLGGKEAQGFARTLSTTANGAMVVYAAPGRELFGLKPATVAADAFTVPVIRRAAGTAAGGFVRASDIKGHIIGEAPFTFAAEGASTEAKFTLPVELRNDIVRLDIEGQETAGAVQLLDDRFRRRQVGLISGGTVEDAQPLLSPLYYISRALAPFADVRQPREANAALALPQIIKDGASVIVMADVGSLTSEAEDSVAKWINAGGTLVRFAGPRLAATDDTLVPVTLRRGDRVLGGTMSWQKPQALASFNAQSPFAGLTVPGDVVINRQVLAEPDGTLANRTWAALADGTPLVTAAPTGKGWLVLFHVTADTSWSNLPLSGAFVEMLRRIVAFSGGSAASGTDGAAAQRPYRLLDGSGHFSPPTAAAEGVNGDLAAIAIGPQHPPGLYGSEDGFRALNLLNDASALVPLELAGVSGATLLPYPTVAPTFLAPWLLAAALALVGLDALAVLWLNGGFRRPRQAAATAAVLVLAAVLAAHGGGWALADDAADTFALAALDKIHLAYVITGEAETDATSRAGLQGLSQVLADRTALVPGNPIGIDPAKDELAFFPLIYWPVVSTLPAPNEATMARIDAYMRQGGTVIFDTRDQLDRAIGPDGQANTPAAQRLRQMLGSLDIPPLQPVPADHVLTKAFYLLNDFPGRYTGGTLWVEATDAQAKSDRPVQAGDGVSTILITENDFAGAWATDATGSYLYPTVPAEARQRELAYRAGINIVMYAMTGNYKADQVHVPALLERLGQ